tara:strand:- start:151 stop:1095 length:945 start_codon:yes stop_codon:yes gene_type:complete
MTVYITDYIIDADIEREILGSDLSDVKEKTEVLLVWHQLIDRKYLSEFPNLKGLVRYGVGFDNVVLEDVKERNLIFCNTPDYGTNEVSDTAIAMILNLTRGVSRYDFLCREYADGMWQENTLTHLRRSNKQLLGVIGAGRIGSSVLKKAKAIGFNCSFYDPLLPLGYENRLGVDRFLDLETLCKKSDIISIHAPLNEETRGMINKKFISNMKSGSYLVNTARGEIIEDIDDFIPYLKNNNLRGLAFDVLKKEPPKVKGLIKMWKDRESWLTGRLIINPHTSYYTHDSYKEMRVKASKNAKKILRDETPKYIISQ